MSTLENIRKHPGLVITVIGVALVLFILTAFITGPSLFNIDRDTVAKVDGTKIKYNDLMARTQELQEQYKQRGNANVDYGMVERQALEGIISETLFNNELDRLGITVTKDEMQAALLGSTAVAQATQYANSLGFNTTDEFYKFAYSDDPQAPIARQMWSQMEDNIRENLKMMKFASLLDALAVNKLDAQAYYDDNATSARVAIVKRDFSLVPDDQVEVTDAEIKVRYNKDKEKYAIKDEQRKISYIVVNPVPSADDYQAAQTEVEDAIIGLRQLDGLDAVNSNYNFEITNIVGTANSINDYAIKNELANLKADSAGVKLVSFNGNSHVIAKLLDNYTTPDSVFVDVALFDTQTVSADSVAAQLNAGVAPDQIAGVLASEDKVTLPLVGSPFTAYKGEFTNAPAGKYVIPENSNSLFTILTNQNAPNGGVAIRVKNFTAPVEVYEIARIERKVEPSSATINLLTENLNGYINEHPDAQKFVEGAPEYSVQTLFLDPSMLQVANLPQSSGAARWAMEGKKGEVSDVFTDDNKSYLLAMAISDVYKGYRPVTDADVNAQIKALLTAEKKGEKLVNDYKGKANDIAGYAVVMETTPDTININYGQDYVRGFIPGDPKLLANVAVAAPGKVVGPIDTRSGVVVFEVIDINKNPRDFDFDTDAATFDRAQGPQSLMPHLDDILRGGKTIKYQVQRFSNKD